MANTDSIPSDEYMRYLERKYSLRPKEVEAFYGIRTRRLNALRQRMSGPTYIQTSSHEIYYTHESIKSWLKLHEVTSSETKNPGNQQPDSSEKSRRPRRDSNQLGVKS